MALETFDFYEMIKWQGKTLRNDGKRQPHAVAPNQGHETLKGHSWANERLVNEWHGVH